jgi:hypothetical protein
MFLRVSKQRLESGRVLETFQIAESTWDRQKKRSRTRIIYNFGQVDDPAVVERLRKLAQSILRRCSPEEIVADDRGGGWSMPGATAMCSSSKPCGGN